MAYDSRNAAADQKSRLMEFVWSHDASDARLTGDMTGWNSGVPMTKGPDGKYKISLRLRVGSTVLYKYIINGEWMYDPKAPFREDQYGNINNYIEVLPAYAESDNAIAVNADSGRTNTPTSTRSAGQAAAGVSNGLAASSSENSAAATASALTSRSPSGHQLPIVAGQGYIGAGVVREFQEEYGIAVDTSGMGRGGRGMARSVSASDLQSAAGGWGGGAKGSSMAGLSKGMGMGALNMSRLRGVTPRQGMSITPKASSSASSYAGGSAAAASSVHPLARDHAHGDHQGGRDSRDSTGSQGSQSKSFAKSQSMGANAFTHQLDAHIGIYSPSTAVSAGAGSGGAAGGTAAGLGKGQFSPVLEHQDENEHNDAGSRRSRGASSSAPALSSGPESPVQDAVTSVSHAGGACSASNPGFEIGISDAGAQHASDSHADRTDAALPLEPSTTVATAAPGSKRLAVPSVPVGQLSQTTTGNTGIVVVTAPSSPSLIPRVGSSPGSLGGGAGAGFISSSAVSSAAHSVSKGSLANSSSLPPMPHTGSGQIPSATSLASMSAPASSSSAQASSAVSSAAGAPGSPFVTGARASPIPAHLHSHANTHTGLGFSHHNASAPSTFSSTIGAEMATAAVGIPISIPIDRSAMVSHSGLPSLPMNFNVHSGGSGSGSGGHLGSGALDRFGIGGILGAAGAGSLGSPGTNSAFTVTNTQATLRREGKLVLAMVGLPARGKTFMARRLKRHLSWMSYRIEIFNVGNYRRKYLGANQPHDFFDPSNEHGERARNEMARIAFDEMVQSLRDETIDIAIFDATNTTRERRRWLLNALKQRDPTFKLVFIESICNDESIIRANVRETKLKSPDYRDVPEEVAVSDFLHRIQHYMTIYQPLGEIDEDDVPYIKLIDVGRQIIANQINGFLNSRIMFFLSNLHITPRPIWLTRHGESEYNVQGRIGGDSMVAPRGQAYALRLAAFMNKLYPPGQSELVVWTSTLRRTMMTAAPLGREIVTWKALDEIDAGICDGMTYEAIAATMPEEYASRAKNKFTYRYPRGESYQDIVHRLEPVIIELMRQKTPVLIVSHQATLRVLYAYLTDKPPETCPDVLLPLHTVVQLTQKAYGAEEVRHELM